LPATTGRSLFAFAGTTTRAPFLRTQVFAVIRFPLDGIGSNSVKKLPLGKPNPPIESPSLSPLRAARSDPAAVDASWATVNTRAQPGNTRRARGEPHLPIPLACFAKDTAIREGGRWLSPKWRRCPFRRRSGFRDQLMCEKGGVESRMPGRGPPGSLVEGQGGAPVGGKRRVAAGLRGGFSIEQISPSFEGGFRTKHKSRDAG